MFNGEDTSPFYYVAVMRYLVTRFRGDRQIDEFFDTLKRLFKESIQSDHPPPPL